MLIAPVQRKLFQQGRDELGLHFVDAGSGGGQKLLLNPRFNPLHKSRPEADRQMRISVDLIQNSGQVLEDFEYCSDAFRAVGSQRADFRQREVQIAG